MFGLMCNENEDWRRLPMRKFSFYCLPNIVWMIKSRGLRWAGHVARMEKSKSSLKILTGKRTGKISRKV